MISWILGTDRFGNLVRFADNSGSLIIFPACSSLTGVSFALLCWITLSHASRHKPSAHDLIWCGLARASVIVVNIARISIMGLSERGYQAAHSPLGNVIANTVTLILLSGLACLVFDVNYSPAFKWFIALLLPVTIVWKLTAIPHASSYELKDKLVEFLINHQFDVVVLEEWIDYMPRCRSSRSCCRPRRVLADLTSPQM